MGFATEDIRNSATLSEGEKAQLKRIEDEKIAAEVKRQLMEIEQQNKTPTDNSNELVNEIADEIVRQDETDSGIDSLPFGIDPEQELNRILGEEIIASDPESFPIVNGSLNPNIRTWVPGISGFDGVNNSATSGLSGIGPGHVGVSVYGGDNGVNTTKTRGIGSATSDESWGNREKVIDIGGKGVGYEKATRLGADSIIQSVKLEDVHVTDQSPQKKWFGMSTFTDKRERFGFFMFMLPITLMSIVSMIHLVDFFRIGTSPTTAWMLGIAFELASLSTIVALVLLRKISRIALISVFFLLYALQMIGNIYSPFATINPQEASRLFDFFGFSTESISSQRWVAIIQGSILPTVNLLLFKLTSNYLRSEK